MGERVVRERRVGMEGELGWTSDLERRGVSEFPCDLLFGQFWDIKTPLHLGSRWDCPTSTQMADYSQG